MIHSTLLDSLPPQTWNDSTVTGAGCFSCGSIDGPFVVASAHGSTDDVYTCSTCAGVIATAFGWIDPVQARELVNQLQALTEDLLAKGEEVTAARHELSALGAQIGAQVIDFLAEREKRRPEPVAS